MFKRFSFLAVFIMFSAAAFAATIDSPSIVPKNVSWGFSASIGAGSTATISIDDSKIAEVFSSGDVIYKAYSPRVSQAYMYGDEVVVYHIGLAEGTHTISIDSSDGSDSVEVKAIGLPDSDAILSDVDARIEEKLGDYDAKFLSQDIDNKEFWKRINENTDNLASFESSISENSGSISSVSSEVGSLSSKLASAEARIAELEGIEAEREAARLAAEEEASKSPIAGLVNAAGGLAGSLAVPMGIIFVIVIVAGAFLVLRDRLPKMDSIYSAGEKDEYNLPVSKEDEKIADEILSGGKWAFGNDSKEE